MGVTPALVRYRAEGLRREAGSIVAKNRIIAEVSRHEVAEAFMSPAPNKIVEKLRRENKLITLPQAICSSSAQKFKRLKKGLFFPSRARKLYELYLQHDGLEDIDERTKKQDQQRYFKRTFEEIYRDCRSYYSAQEIQCAEQSSKLKMAMIFKWYFRWSTRLALSGEAGHEVNYQVQCGPALGAFNAWVKGSRLENWRNRHVDEIGLKLMQETAAVLNNRYQQFWLAGSF